MGGGRLGFDELHKHRHGRFGLLRLEQRSAEALKRLGIIRPHDQRGAVLLFGQRQVTFVQRDLPLTHGVEEARGHQGAIKPRVLRAILLGLHKEADGAAKVGLLHADVTHAGQGVGVVGRLIQNGLETGFRLRNVLGF